MKGDEFDKEKIHSNSSFFSENLLIHKKYFPLSIFFRLSHLLNRKI